MNILISKNKNVSKATALSYRKDAVSILYSNTIIFYLF